MVRSGDMNNRCYRFHCEGCKQVVIQLNKPHRTVQSVPWWGRVIQWVFGFDEPGSDICDNCLNKSVMNGVI